jgi:hypothetical protein
MEHIQASPVDGTYSSISVAGRQGRLHVGCTGGFGLHNLDLLAPIPSSDLPDLLVGCHCQGCVKEPQQSALPRNALLLHTSWVRGPLLAPPLNSGFGGGAEGEGRRKGKRVHEPPVVEGHPMELLFC